MLHAPGTSGHRLTENSGIGHQAPVGADDAVETQFAAQQVSNDPFAEGETHFLVLSAERHPVVGHDLRPASGDCSAERLEVVVEVAARIHLLPAVREVRILSIELRTTARKCLVIVDTDSGPRCSPWNPRM